MRKNPTSLSLAPSSAPAPFPALPSAILPLAGLLLVGLLLSGCGKDLFATGDVPRTATEVRYAKEVCDEAGIKSRACDDARRQMDLRCYRTLGTVDCYRSDDPFGMTDRDRAALAPIDRRPTSSTERPPEEPPVVKITPEEPAASKAADDDRAAKNDDGQSEDSKAPASTTNG